MKISYNWLKQHIELEEPAEKIAELLTGTGLEVENVEPYESVKGGLKGLVIGKVLSCEKHPGADKLKKTTVDVGNGTVLPIVCGAPNVAEGQKVIVATVGTTLYPAGHEPFKISKAKIRGEVSEGMICAEDEIGLGTGHEGIMVLTTDLEPGTSAAEYFNIESDYILEIGLTPNRGDAASHFGVARDLKALLGRNLIKHEYPFQSGNSAPVSVEVKKPEACIRYCGVTLTGLEVKESPDWLKTRLKSIGLSPINNIVDVTNYILHDLGQPLHAFDLSKVKGNKIVVDTAIEGTEFVTLDGETRKLRNFDLMINNEVEPMCIAGVFGGADSGVGQKTTSIFLESACFSPDYVRKTSMAHGIKTDSSFRFERGTDPDMPPYALQKAVNLILEVAGGKVSSALIDVYPSPVAYFNVKTSFSGIRRLIGKDISEEEIKSILSGLEITVESEQDGQLTLEVPPYRSDVQREADIVEEIIRIYGYDNIEIPGTINAGYLADFPLKDPEKIQTLISQLLSGNGYNEIVTNSLTKPAYNKILGRENESVEILNKLSEDLGEMRQTLLFTGLEVIAYNLNRRNKDLKLYEFGKTYHKNNGGYQEHKRLAIFLTGSVSEETWMEKETPASFFNLKQTVLNILAKLNVSEVASVPSQAIMLKYGIDLKIKDKVLVSFGLVQEKFLKMVDVKQPVWYADFDFELLFRSYQPDVVYREVSKFPEVRRDLSLVLDRQVSFNQIKELALQKERKLLKSLNVFDVYEGKNIGEGKKSYSISFILQDFEKTLTDEVIDKTMSRLMDSFEKELGALIRK